MNWSHAMVREGRASPQDTYPLPPEFRLNQRVRLSSFGLSSKHLAQHLCPGKDRAKARGTVVGGSKDYPGTCVAVRWDHSKTNVTTPTRCIEEGR